MNAKRPYTLFDRGTPSEVRWPWDDRGRSALTPEEIEREAAAGRQWFDAAMRGRLAEFLKTLAISHEAQKCT